LIVGYVLGVMFGSIFAPAVGALRQRTLPDLGSRVGVGLVPRRWRPRRSRGTRRLRRHRRHRQPFRLGRGPDVSARDADHRAVLTLPETKGRELEDL